MSVVVVNNNVQKIKKAEFHLVKQFDLIYECIYKYMNLFLGDKLSHQPHVGLNYI